MSKKIDYHILKLEKQCDFRHKRSGIPWNFYHKKIYYISDILEDIQVSIIENDPPNTPNITGPTSGNTGTAYDYNFVTTDPNGDNISYYIEWGDDSHTEWLGPYSSGEQITKSHTWSEKAPYVIRAKAKDVFDEESNWGTLEVTMPKNKILVNSLFLKFLERFPRAFPILRNLLGL